MHITGTAFAAVALALFLGAALQGVIGFGMIVLAYPVLITVEPALIPQTTLMTSLPVVALMAWRGRGNADWSEVGWVTLGRLPGYIAALIVLGILSRDLLSIVGGLSVLSAVALSLWAPHVPRTRQTMILGGATSALFGTAISIGGPPIGLLYQSESGERLRSTVSLQMLFGAPVSLLVLLLAGRMEATDLRTGLALLPFTLTGNYSAKWVIPHFDDRLRPLVLSVCALAAGFAILRVVLG